MPLAARFSGGVLRAAAALLAVPMLGVMDSCDGQMRLDFSASASVRSRRALSREEDEGQLRMFAHVPNVDVHLRSATEAVADLVSPSPEQDAAWLRSLVGTVSHLRTRRVVFPARHLDRLLFVRPPAQVTLDAAALAVARGLWADRLGFSPLRVSAYRRRLIGWSFRWPSGFRVKDAPWGAVAALLAAGVEVDADVRARALMRAKLAAGGEQVASAGLAGSTVVLEASHPALLEDLGLPALARGSSPGSYRLPLLAARPLLDERSISLSPQLRRALKRVHRRVRPTRQLPGFPYQLHPFQARDAAQAKRVLETVGGVLLAGDMGSGKTIVSLALLSELDLFPALIVAPLAAFSTWERELGDTVGKRVLVGTGPADQVWEEMEAGEWDAVVLSYDRLHTFVELIERLPFRVLVADEIQRIKNPGSRRSRSLRSLSHTVERRVGLSGTPLTNSVEDLLPVGAFLAPSEWPPRASSKFLSDLYVGDPERQVTEHLHSMMVRRRMEDTGVELPKRRDHRVTVPLTFEQRRALDALEEAARRAREEGELGDRMHVFARLHEMRKIIASPAAAGVAGPNPKVDAALELVDDFVELGRDVVVFCDSRQVFSDLGEALAQRGLGFAGIWGSSSADERVAAERRFHEDPDCRVFLGTIQSCSEALTLSPTGTAAVFVAYRYSPAELAQAEARIYRMNQVHDVDIVYVHASAPGGTLDDRMVEILEVKRRLFAQVVDRQEWSDDVDVHLALSDLVFLLTGERDEGLERGEADRLEAEAARRTTAERVKATAHRHRFRDDEGVVFDDGSLAEVVEDDRRA